MTDPKSAMLEIALRAVQQHLERDEYTAAGDVVMQALARDEQMTAPDLRATFRDTMDSLDMAELAVQQTARISDLESLVRRLLADHQRVEPHHADLCALCREAQAAIDGRLILPVAEWVNEEQGFQYLASGRLPDGTKLYAQAAIDGQPSQGERQPDEPVDRATCRHKYEKTTDYDYPIWRCRHCSKQL